MKIYINVAIAILLGLPAFAQKGIDARLQAATESLHAMMNADDKSIPQDLLERASCVR